MPSCVRLLLFVCKKSNMFIAFIYFIFSLDSTVLKFLHLFVCCWSCFQCIDPEWLLWHCYVPLQSKSSCRSQQKSQCLINIPKKAVSGEKVRPNSLSTKLPHSLRQERKKCSQWCDYFSAESTKLWVPDPADGVKCGDKSPTLPTVHSPHMSPPLWYKQEGFAAQPHFPVAMLSYAAQAQKVDPA